MTRPRGHILVLGRRQGKLRCKIRWRECDSSGKAVHRSKVIEVASKGDAQDDLNKRIAEAPTDKNEPVNAEITLSTYVRDHFWPYLLTKKLKPSTRISYECVLARHVTPHLGAMRLVDIKPPHITSLFQKMLSAGMSKKTARNVFFLLRVLFTHALESGFIDTLPVRTLIHKPELERHEKPSWSPEQVKAILDAVPVEHKALFECIALTSLRLGELLGLKWMHVDLEKQRLRIDQSLWNGKLVAPKTRDSKDTVYFGQRLAAALREHCKRSAHTTPDDFVFCKPDGSPLNPDVLRRDVLYPILYRLNIPRIKGASGFHAFRHSGATIVDKKTGNPEVSQRMLRHSDVSTTEGYIHGERDRYEKQKREAARALEEAIFGKLVPQPVPSGHEIRGGRLN